VLTGITRKIISSKSKVIFYPPIPEDLGKRYLGISKAKNSKKLLK
jgi:hypothetical protein